MKHEFNLDSCRLVKSKIATEYLAVFILLCIVARRSFVLRFFVIKYTYFAVSCLFFVVVIIMYVSLRVVCCVAPSST